MKYLLMLFSIYSFASIPTMEGLFRHPGNPEVSEEVVVLLFEASEKIELESEGIPVEEDKLFVKILLQNEKGKKGRRIIAKYPNSKFSNQEIQNLTIINKFDERILEDESIVRKILMSTLEMYSLNTSKNVVSVLKKYSDDFMANGDILNSDKKDLLKKYMEFLKHKKEQKLKEKEEKSIKMSEDATDKLQAEEDIVELVSPLVSEDEEEKKKIDELIKSSMYTKPENLKLEKEGENFYWVLRLKNMIAKFTNEEHVLKYLKITDENGEYEMIPNDHVVYSGKYKLPKNIIMKFNNREIQIDIKSFYTATNKNKTFSKRISEYKEFHKKSVNEEKVVETVPVSDDESSLTPGINKLDLNTLVY